jgi:hypothetical protein
MGRCITSKFMIAFLASECAENLTREQYDNKLDIACILGYEIFGAFIRLYLE